MFNLSRTPFREDTMARTKSSWTSKLLAVITVIAVAITFSVAVYTPMQTTSIRLALICALAAFWLRRIFCQVPFWRSDVVFQICAVIGVEMYNAVSEKRLPMHYVLLSVPLIAPVLFVWFMNMLNRPPENLDFDIRDAMKKGKGR